MVSDGQCLSGQVDPAGIIRGSKLTILASTTPEVVAPAASALQRQL